MPDDYLAKSGAKALITTAIAEVLTLRPRVPVDFLASHFQGLVANKSASVVSYLRACHPSSPSFSTAVEKAYYDLAATEVGTTLSLSTNNSTDALPARARSAGSGQHASRKVRASGPATVSAASFSQVLSQLCVDFPKPLQTRLLQAITSVANDTPTKDSPRTQSVGLAQFHRGVHACLLLEELLDAATLMFQSLESSSTSPDGVSIDALMTTLRSAASSQFPEELAMELTPLLVKSPAPHTSRTTSNRHLHLNDIYDLLFNLVLQE